MNRKRKIGDELYGTKQIAELLDIPEWRVKNIAEVEAYGVPPTQRIGTGRGSRRLYDRASVLRMAIAYELVEADFTPEGVGRALREIPESLLTSYDETLGKRPAREMLPLLVGERGKWRVRKNKEVKAMLADRFDFLDFTDAKNPGGAFVLNFLSVVASVNLGIENQP